MNELLKKMNYKLGTVAVLGAPKEFEPILSAWKPEVEVLRELPAEESEKKSRLYSHLRRIGERGDGQDTSPKVAHKPGHGFLGRLSQKDVAHVRIGHQPGHSMEAHGA